MRPSRLGDIQGGFDTGVANELSIMMMFKACLYWILTLAVACQLAWADGGNGDASSEPLRPVRVQLKWAHQFQFAGYYAAIENGYYRRAGLDVSLIEYTPALTPIDQLIGGRVDFAVADSGALIYRSTGVPLIALAVIFQNSPSILISRGDKGISHLSDLKNKKIMLAGGYLNAELMATLHEAGISSDDFQLVPAETTLQALIDGDIDAYNGYTTNEPYLLNQRGIPFISFAPLDYGVDFYGDILITSEAVLAHSPEMVADFRAATLKGWVYALENPETVVDLIIEKYNSQNKSREHLLFEAEEAKKLILPNVVPVGYMNEERWQRIEAKFIAQGLFSNRVNMADFLYDADSELTLNEALNKYRIALGVGAAAFAGIFMILHMLRLKNQVNTSTRELKREKLRAEQEARTDVLTGLPNHRYFFEQLARDMGYAERNAIPLTLISLDIDFFKDVNDQYGHGAGDEALRQVGKIFKKHTRSGEIAARIGGEEFAMVCLNTSSEEAFHLAERIRMETAATPITYRNRSFTLTLSGGVITMVKGENIDQLLRNVDMALYKAKHSGRNRICILESRAPMLQS
ncbi:MAG: ABC transporter substrate-binding protein [Porticoccaceae bacterium]